MVTVELKQFSLRQHRYANFVDKLRVYVRGGTGGTGLPQYGGVGGKGGDVYVEASEHVKDLKQLRDKFTERRFIAGNGEDSRKYRLVGKPGNNVTVYCPVGIDVCTDSGRVLGELNTPGDKVLVAIGGRGGDVRNQYNGMTGQRQSISLDLKLIADVGFVGYPNAGKSTLLKAISRASPKIANYPFTTLAPNIGVVEYVDYRRLKCADLPGLIEGAHENYGLGHKFLKHVERTKLLLFVVDINGFQFGPRSPHRTAIETLLHLNRELEMYDERLLDKPAVLAISKIDSDSEQKRFDKFKMKLESITSGKYDNVDASIVPKKKLIEFDEVIPFSSQTAFNVPYLRERLRDVIDFHEDQKLKESGQATSFRELVESDKRRYQADDVKVV